MNILITGICGYIGKNLVSYFNDLPNLKIYGLDVKNVKMDGVNKIYSWDKLDKIGNVDCVIHLAGLAHDLIGKTSLNEYISVNFGLTKKIFEWSIKAGVKKFIFFSSIKAVSDNPTSSMNETDIKKPNTPYGISKSMAEDFLLNNNELEKLYILRPVMVYGPKSKGNLNKLYNFITMGYPWPFGSFQNKRSYCSIVNLNFILKNLIERNDIKEGVYNISDNDSISTNDLVRIIYLSLNLKPRIIKIPKFIIYLIFRFLGFFKKNYAQIFFKITGNYEVKNQKIKNEIGKDLLISTKDALIDTFNDMKN